MNVFAIDASRQMCKLAFHRLKTNAHPQRLAHARAQNLPFPDQFFTEVYCTFPSEYIFDPVTLLEAYRVLSSGGSLFIVGVALIRGTSLLDRLAALLYAVTGQAAEPDGHWQEPLIQAGFVPSLERTKLERAEVIHFVGKKP
jgi:ubiquinone/menaquinone biosynthesis C-methylase UbiE